MLSNENFKVYKPIKVEYEEDIGSLISWMRNVSTNIKILYFLRIETKRFLNEEEHLRLY